jgi:hypothetical protein
MTSLLDSWIEHRRIRVLSRKLRESTIHDEDPPNRRIPATLPHLPTAKHIDNEITMRQRNQRLRRRREERIRSLRDTDESDIHDMDRPDEGVHVARSVSSESDELTGRQRNQTIRWQRERNARNEVSRNVSPLLPTARLQVC